MIARSMIARLRIAATAALFAAAGCWDAHRGSSLGPDDVAPVRLALRAVAQAQAGTTLEVRATYARRDGSAVPMGMASTTLTAGASDAVRLTVDIAPCLRDPERAGGGAESCAASLEVRLLRGATELDTRRLEVALQPGRDVEVPQEVALFEVARVGVAVSGGAAPQLEVRQSLTLVATVSDAAGAPVVRPVAWESRQPGIAAVNANTGQVTGISSGTATVVASVGGRTGELTVAVSPEGVRRLVISPRDTLVTVGSTVQYSVQALGATNNVLPAVPLQFEVGDPSKASVSPAGAVLAIAAGTTRVYVSTTAGSGGATVRDSAMLRVETRPTIVLSVPALTIRTQGGAPLPRAEQVTVTNGGGGSLGTLTIAQVSDPVAATLSGPSAPATLTVSATRVLGPGESITRTVRVSSSTPGVAPVDLPVTVLGETPPAVIVDRDLVEIGPLDSAEVREVTVAVTTEAGRTLEGLSRTIEYVPLATPLPTSWLQTDLDQPRTPTTLRLRVNAGTLSAGTYDARVTIGSTISGVRPAVVTVRMRIRERARLIVSPDTLDFGVLDSGAVSQPLPITITGSGGQAFAGVGGVTTYSAGTPARWLRGALSSTVTPLTGQITASADSLPPGRYVAVVTFTSVTPAASTQLVVRLEVRARVVITPVPPSPTVVMVSDPSAVEMGPIAPGEFEINSVQVRRSDRARFVPEAMRLNISYPVGQPTGWLRTLVGAAGTIPADEWQFLSFEARSTGLVQGTYRATISVAMADAAPALIAVTLQVQGQTASGNAPATSLGLGFIHSCAVLSGGGAWCWGANDDGRLGNNTTTDARIPVEVRAIGVSFVSLAAGGGHTCGLTTVGTVWCWGLNDIGQLGTGTTANSRIPVQVQAPGVTFVELTAGNAHTCGRTSAGAIWCWGSNEQGQLGIGSTASSSASPVQVQGVAFVEVVAGNRHTCARTSAGTVWCWGENVYGQLGNNSTADARTPVQVQTGSISFVDLSAGSDHTCGRTSAAAVWCWGYNEYGQLGNNSTANARVPVQVILPNRTR